MATHLEIIDMGKQALADAIKWHEANRGRPLLGVELVAFQAAWKQAWTEALAAVILHGMTTTYERPAKARRRLPPMGKKQSDILDSLKSHNGLWVGLRADRHGGGDNWTTGSGWVWTTAHETATVLETLVKRGLVERTASPYGMRERVEFRLKV